MVLTGRLLLEPAASILAFAGGKGRLGLLRRVAEELTRDGRQVTIVSSLPQKLPYTGELVVGTSLDLLLPQINAAFERTPLVYAGSKIANQMLSGFNITSLRGLCKSFPGDYLLIDLDRMNASLFNNKCHYRKFIARPPWHQAIAVFDLSLLDGVALRQQVEDLPAFQKGYPGVDRVDARTLVDFLCDRQAGMGDLFGAPKATLAVLLGVETVLQENRALTIARELQAGGVEHIALADLETNMIKRLESHE